MAMGTQTKFLIGLMLLVNALVLINIRRASPDLPRVAIGAEGMQGGDSRERIGGEDNRPGG
ncbi:unnamed protein product, partial [Ectocarpus sp. 12 AP-2014]